jgi:hypothetical protein
MMLMRNLRNLMMMMKISRKNNHKMILTTLMNEPENLHIFYSIMIAILNYKIFQHLRSNLMTEEKLLYLRIKNLIINNNYY